MSHAKISNGQIPADSIFQGHGNENKQDVGSALDLSDQAKASQRISQHSFQNLEEAVRWMVSEFNLVGFAEARYTDPRQCERPRQCLH